jgi:hypothetical protein
MRQALKALSPPRSTDADDDAPMRPDDLRASDLLANAPGDVRDVWKEAVNRYGHSVSNSEVGSVFVERLAMPTKPEPSEAQRAALDSVESLNVRDKIRQRVEAEGGWGRVPTGRVWRIRHEEADAWEQRQRRAAAVAEYHSVARPVEALARYLPMLDDKDVADLVATVDRLRVALIGERANRLVQEAQEAKSRLERARAARDDEATRQAIEDLHRLSTALAGLDE